MGESKHTPGPWKFVAPHFIGTDEVDHQTIAYLDDHRNRKVRLADEMRANGNLIGALNAVAFTGERVAAVRAAQRRVIPGAMGATEDGT